MDYNKQFLIIGHQNAITYKEIFPYIKENRMWLGYGFNRNCAHFISPNYEDTASDADHREGMIRVSGVMWFTNLRVKKREEEMEFTKKYNPKDYPKYDNYDAIEVSKSQDIPEDYDGVMGVPITFLTKYNPNQFEIVGTDSPYYVEELGIRKIGEKWVNDYRRSGGTGHITANMHSLCLYDKNGVPQSVYKRILIRKKQ
jgi:hypothetical protein